jgi:hypothetical protein
MSLKRKMLVELPRAVGVAAVGLVFLGAGGVVVCSSYSTYKDLPIDCSPASGYEFYSKATDPDKTRDLTLDNFPDGWYASADTTAGVAKLSVADPIPDGEVCQNTKAVVLISSHTNDWGSLFGPWDFGNTAQNASDWEGIAFFARAPGSAAKSFSISLSDDNSEATTPGRQDPDAGTGRCTNYISDGGTSSQTGGGSTGIDPQTGTPLSGSGTTRAPYPDECGNGYTVAMEVTSKWRFYTIPFGDLQQASNPNRVPNAVFQAGTVPGTGLLTSALRHLVIRGVKAADMELWLTNVAFYRKKTH